MPRIIYLSDEERRNAKREAQRKYRENNLLKVRASALNWYNKNKDELNKKNKKLIDRRVKYSSLQEKIEASKRRSKKYRDANKEKLTAIRKRWVDNNRDKSNNINRRWYSNNKERASELRKKSYKKHNGKRLAERKEYYYKNISHSKNISNKWKMNNADKVKEYTKYFYSINKNKLIDKSKRYRDANKHKIKNYRKNNVAAFRSYSLRRRDRSVMVNENITKSLINLVYNKFNSQCFKCHSAKRLSIDHHYPLSLGNPLSINNAVLLCGSCNSSKGNRLPESFYSPEQLTDLQLNYGISKSPLKEEQPSLFEARMPKNLERDNGLFEAMNAA